MKTTSIDHLPDDVVLDIVQQLGTARDVAHLGASTRRMYSLAHQAAWKSFVKYRFPATDDSLAKVKGWSGVADRLTYLDRCWEKRGFFLNIFNERPPQHREPRGRPRPQSVPFHPVLDAHLLSAGQTELVAWGVGEDLLIRHKSEPDTVTDLWFQVSGASSGYTPGTGDVTAVSVLELGSEPEVCVGRANGDVHLLSAAADTCGRVDRTLLALDETVEETGAAIKKSPGQLAVTWTEWQPRMNLMACCRSSILTLYDLGDHEESSVSPTAQVDVSKFSAGDETSLLRNVKFMGNGVIACALGGSRKPLRFYKIMPTGLEPLNGPGLPEVASSGSSSEKTTVRAIEPVGHVSNQHLLLSAWDDGLKDIRSPLGADYTYRDKFQPFQAGSSLLVYGTDRFVAGSNHGPDLRFFDFRFPKAYHHTDALPCDGRPPYPRAARDYTRSVGDNLPRVNRCDHLRNITCTRHAQSRQDSWRPDAVLHVGNSFYYDRVYSLAKASDVSGTFYCGLRGTVMEVNLTLSEHVTRHSFERAAPPGWQVSRVAPNDRAGSHPRSKMSLQEPGIGLEKNGLEIDDEGGIPPLWYHSPTSRPEKPKGKGASRPRVSARRLDRIWTEVPPKA